jgi:hypothetical protein
MRLSICAAFLLGAFGVLSGVEVGTAAPSGKPSSPTVQQAYEGLLAVHEFAFGGVGFAGTPSPGEKAYLTILARPDALERFRSVLAKGSPEARLYALTGIRQLHPESFGAAAKALLEPKLEVTTISGCTVMREKAEAVVKRIATGLYDNRAIKTTVRIRRP